MSSLHDFPTAVVTVQTVCPVCRTPRAVTVPKDGYARWKDGVLIQKAMPSLTDDEREALMTGICDPCWNSTFNEDY